LLPTPQNTASFSAFYTQFILDNAECGKTRVFHQQLVFYSELLYGCPVQIPHLSYTAYLHFLFLCLV